MPNAISNQKRFTDKDLWETRWSLPLRSCPTNGIFLFGFGMNIVCNAAAFVTNAGTDMRKFDPDFTGFVDGQVDLTGTITALAFCR
jgi:hypothetical protein